MCIRDRKWSNPANGLQFFKVSVPIGVIGIIYESRPNVTIDAASLCLRSGNVSILRGGSECIETNKKLYECIQEALKDLQLNPYLVCFVEQTDRTYVQELLQAEGKVDVIIHEEENRLYKRSLIILESRRLNI